VTAPALLRRVVGDPKVYDAVQRLFGLEHTRRRLRPLLADTAGRLVLDVGAGTGLVQPLLPPTARYVWLDNDVDKLRGARPAGGRLRGILGDATRLGLRDGTVDVALCLAMSHHLADHELEAMLAELARVVRERLVFLDAVVVPSSLRSRLLWSLDRGRHPRTLPALRAAIERRFEIRTLEQYAVYHRYLLCTAAPRR
jgi:SAM-dependent methyltransferase